MNKLIIPGRLPGLNEYVRACRIHPKEGARLKRDAGDLVKVAILASRIGKIPVPCVMRYTWYEANQKRDLDNISAFGRKVIQDALVEMKKLPGDGWACVRGFSDSFEVDRDNPRIEIEFMEVKNEDPACIHKEDQLHAG